MRPDFETLTNFVGQQLARGKLTSNTANSYYSSLSRVFESATDIERANVLQIDLDDLFSRFRTANATLGDNTTASYEGRVRAVVNRFAEHVRSGGDTEEIPPTMSTLAIPLRAGIVKIDGLPSDLTPAEANRIATMIVAMAS